MKLAGCRRCISSWPPYGGQLDGATQEMLERTLERATAGGGLQADVREGVPGPGMGGQRESADELLEQRCS